MSDAPDAAPPAARNADTGTLVEDDLAVDDPVEVADEPVVLTGPAGGPDTPGAPVIDDDADGMPGATGDDPGGATAVDPRMKRRWIDQRRHEGRRRLRIVVGVSAFAVVAVLAWVVAHSPLLGADTITVHGTSRLDPATVRTAAGVGSGAPLLFLDEAAAAKRVERLPEVAHATVRTELPDTVVIDVVERRPIAWAEAGAPDDVALIDGHGRVFARVTDPPDGLLRLAGVRAGAVGTQLPHGASLRQIGRLPFRLRYMTDHFGLTDSGAAVLVLRAGDFGADSVVLGDGTATARKGAIALAVLDDLRARGEHRRAVDVSVPDAPVVR